MANDNDLRLLGVWTSPFVLRARLALSAKNVKYKFVEENLADKSELLLKSNPVHKKVPVLLHGHKAISESFVIVEYVDETWSSGSSLLPSDPYDRALARFWATYANEKWAPAPRAIDTAVGEEAKKAAVDQAVEVLVVLEEAFKKLSKGKPFFGGDHIGYVDIAFGSFLAWLRVREKFHEVTLLDPAKTPELVKWAQRFSQDPAVIGVLPKTEKLLEFAKGIFANMRAAASAPK